MARKLELDLVAKSNADVVLNRVKNAANDFAGELTKKLTSAFGAMALLDKGLEAVNKGFEFVIHSLGKYAQIADQAQKSGMDGQDFQQLAAAAEEAGVSMQTVGKAARQLRILMKDAAGGNQLAIEKFKALGFTQDQISNGTIKTTDVFLQLANAMEGATSDADKLAIMTAIFGDKVATDLLPLLDQARAKLRQTFHETPLMDNQALKDLDAMMDKLGQLKRIFEFIAATAAYQTIFGKGAGGIIARTLPEGPFAGAAVAGIQALATGAVSDTTNGAPDSGPTTDSAKLASLGKGLGDASASMGSGVIGVGASPQIALAEEGNKKLAEIESHLGKIVNEGQQVDPTKPLNRKFPIYSPGMAR